MKLSKLKELHPIAYQVFCTEVIYQESLDYLMKAIVNDNKLDELLDFEQSNFDCRIWHRINDKKMFDYFDSNHLATKYTVNNTVKSWFEAPKEKPKVKEQTPEKKIKKYLKECLLVKDQTEFYSNQQIRSSILLPISMAKDILQILKEYKIFKRDFGYKLIESETKQTIENENKKL